MKPPVIHDLKTERADVGQPLPAALRLLPVLFFSSVSGAIAMSAYSFWQIKVAEENEHKAQEAEAGQKAETKRLDEDSAAVDKEVRNANEVKDWLIGTNQVQPLIKVICSSMTQESTISQITLARRDEMAAHVQMAMTINSAHGQQQVDTLRTAVSGALGYHSYSDNITNKDRKTEVSFDCTWIKSDTPDLSAP